MNSTLIWLLAAVFSLIGWGTLVHFAWIARRWPVERARVVGDIAEWASAASAGGAMQQEVHFALLEFDTAAGIRRARGSLGRAEPWQPGETVEIRYRPASTGKAAPHPGAGEGDELALVPVLDMNLSQRLLFSLAFICAGIGCLAAAMGWIG